MMLAFLVLLTATATLVDAESSTNDARAVSPRVLMRERFPSGLKIDRFSTSWPSSASVMADMLEGATAREMLLENRRRGGRRKLSAQEHERQMLQANRLVNAGKTSLGKPVQTAPKFFKQEEGQEGWKAGLMYVYFVW